MGISMRTVTLTCVLLLQSVTYAGDEGKPAAEGDRRDKPVVNTYPRKTQRIFKAYDKNVDGSVAFDEWLKMKEGTMTDARKAREKVWFDQADASKDGKITISEFHAWRNRKAKPEGKRPAEAGDK